jgi:glutathione peroxidase
MKTTYAIAIILISVSLNAQKTLHDFTVESISGEQINLADYKGKKILIVNVASKCGLTPQYEQLQELYDKYADRNFVIIGFPANNFLNQEPGTNEEIVEFCQANYGVTFPMMAKISVKGEDMHPLYQWLTDKNKNGVWNGEIQWNFHKFLIDEEGNFVQSISPRTSPLDEEIVKWIEE